MITHLFEIELVRARVANQKLGITILVTDGGELHSNNAPSLCAKCNILQKFTCCNTPENNVIIKKIWRTIAEMAISILADSGLPEPFWEEARRVAVYIYNSISPTREATDDTKWQSPRDTILV